MEIATTPACLAAVFTAVPRSAKEVLLACTTQPEAVVHAGRPKYDRYVARSRARLPYPYASTIATVLPPELSPVSL